MKNLYILQTNKPSRLRYKNGGNYALSKEYLSWRYAHHIYITSDEEIQEGWKGYVYKEDVEGGVFTHFYTTNEWYKDAKKIILTTDQDLIKDGVQEIDDEFLEWFVENPKCEYVEVENWVGSVTFSEYRIIIPKEDEIEKAAKDFVLSHDFSLITTQNHLANKCFQFGAKWQKEKSDNEANKLYSEIEYLIMVWGSDGTKTAGSLTRQIMSLIKNQK